MHPDATHEGDAPYLMTRMDGLKQIVPANVKIPGEHADHIVPFLEQLQKNYGTPIACVHDMGTGLHFLRRLIGSSKIVRQSTLKKIMLLKSESI